MVQELLVLVALLVCSSLLIIGSGSITTLLLVRMGTENIQD